MINFDRSGITHKYFAPLFRRSERGPFFFVVNLSKSVAHGPIVIAKSAEPKTPQLAPIMAMSCVPAGLGVATHTAFGQKRVEMPDSDTPSPIEPALPILIPRVPEPSRGLVLEDKPEIEHAEDFPNDPYGRVFGRHNFRLPGLIGPAPMFTTGSFQANSEQALTLSLSLDAMVKAGSIKVREPKVDHG